jgi:hypothetical protein
MYGTRHSGTAKKWGLSVRKHGIQVYRGTVPYKKGIIVQQYGIQVEKLFGTYSAKLRTLIENKVTCRIPTDSRCFGGVHTM